MSSCPKPTHRTKSEVSDELGHPPLMVATRNKQVRALKDMLTKPTGPSHEGKPPSSSTESPPVKEDQECPVTQSFMETLCSSLHEDIQSLKRVLSADQTDIRRNLEELGDRYRP
ncbi:hypothetical protein NDU88_003895 [Pleurodeles waltl]|uniref:Uncharacterized protein n=1 Tax=Pleurodeles waltl TaxID=8319 RepID=A0AAV7KZU5_PLEWA|nr:hypothetical protein NDU88_003895 [Pleurodeles waltl]